MRPTIAVTLPLVLVLTMGLYANGRDEEAADDYPSRPITLIVAFSAGGGTDTGARLLAPLVEERLGQPVNVVNVTGAGGWVGWTQLIRSEPDGYTIAYMNNPAFINGYLNPDMGRPPQLQNVLPFANHVWDTSIWVVRPDSPFSTVQDVLEYAKQNPGQVTMTTTGAFTQHHIIQLILEQTGYQLEPIHTSGAADATTMVLGGNADVLSISVGEALSLVNEGELVPLAVFDERRSDFFPDVPIFSDAAGIDHVSASARGIMAPAGTPPEIIDTLADAFQAAIESPQHVARMEQMGLALRYMGPSEYLEFINRLERTVKESVGW